MTDMTLMRPISSHIVHIRSKAAPQLTAGYNSHFKFLLEDPIKINQGEQINITMSSGEFPYSFYNVSSDVNNRGIIIDDGGIEFNFGNGNYSIYELRDVINASSGALKFSATFDVRTMKLTLTNTDTVSHTINWGQSTAAKMMGFDNNPDNDDVVAAGNSTTSDFVVNMCSVHSLMVRSNIATGNVQSTTHSNSTILQKISIDQNGFAMIYLNQDDYRTTNITQQPQIDQIEIKITDQNNNLIQFNNVNYEMSLIFQVYEKVVDYKHSGSANDRRAVRQRIMNRIADAGAVAPFTPPAQEPEGEIVDNIDDTHPVVGKSDLEDKTEHTILNQLLDMQLE